MVFGFGEGSIDIAIPKTTYSFGETIEGKLALKLKKEKKARQLKITVFAEREVVRTRTDCSRKNSFGGSATYQETETETIFSCDFVIDGEKTYAPPGAEYQFKAQLPGKDVMPQAPEQIQGSGLMNTLMNASIAMSAASQKPAKWYLKATLDAPGIDINKTVQISVQ